MIARTLNSVLNAAMADGHVTVVDVSTSRRRNAQSEIIRLECHVEPHAVASQFDELEAMNDEQLAAADPVRMVISFVNLEQSNPEFNILGAKLRELTLYRASNAYGNAYISARRARFTNEDDETVLTGKDN